MPIESIAVVGYAARLPGAENSAEVWKALIDGRCTVSEIPEDRFSKQKFFDPVPGRAGKSYTFSAGVLENVFDFDATEFGISPLEARQMDPQQRLLLETVSHAFDHAGIDPKRLSGDRTGVYVGASSADHSILALQDAEVVESHFMLGNTLSILANRISFQWDFRGPSLAIDTACSSGLFALDRAVTDIRDGKIDTAIVAGVNLLLSPLPFVGFSHALMLSKDGLCKPFSKDANGYVRSEGAVAFIIRRESVAQHDSDIVRSNIVGTATNTDGWKSGITNPSKDRQAGLLEGVLAEFDVDPNHIAYFEAHGTGTSVGDPVEAMAVGNAYGSHRTDPLPMGSAKGNFGHLEPASGLVGLLKAQLILENGVIPATLHCSDLNPNVDFCDLNLDIVREAAPLDGKLETPFAAVNSFGFGGANAHALICRTSKPELPKQTVAKGLPTLKISASSENSLRDSATHWMCRLEQPSGVSVNAVSNANYRGAKRRLQLTVASGKAGEMADDIREWLAGSDPVGVVTGQRNTPDVKVGFVFSGNGAVWNGMARDIFDTDPVFRRSIQRTSGIFQRLGGIDIAKTLMLSDLESQLGWAETDQSLLFAIQIALVAALRAQGLSPHAVVGHSVGEVAAAATAKAISIETGASIILARSRRLEALRGKGTMAALAAGSVKVLELINDIGSAIEIAAVNSNASTTVAGDINDIDELISVARTHRIAGRRLKIDYPYHSTALDALELELRNDLENVTSRIPRIPFYSSSLGHRVDGRLTQEFWWKNARQEVQFLQAIEAMSADGIGVFVEVSPRPVLQSNIKDIVETQGIASTVLASLDQSNTQMTATKIALKALISGADMDTEKLLGPELPLSSALPLYPFDRENFRLDIGNGLNVLGDPKYAHALLGNRTVADGHEWRAEISTSTLPWIEDHQIHGRNVLPGMAILEMMLEAARQISPSRSTVLSDVQFLRPIVLADDKSEKLRVIHEPTLAKLSVQAWARETWQTISTGRIDQTAKTAPPRVLLDWGDNPKSLYDELLAAGLKYGAAFRQVQSIAQTDRQIDVRLRESSGAEGFQIEPILADACLHPAALFLDGYSDNQAMVPAQIGQCRHYSNGRIAGARLTLVHVSSEQLELDVSLIGDNGQIVVVLSGLRLVPVQLPATTVAQYWDEQRILVASTRKQHPLKQIKRMLHAREKKESDVEVLRSAIAGRLAWDCLKDAATSDDERARASLVLAATFGQDVPIIDGNCPWPTLGVLIDLLVKADPTASDELQSVVQVLDTAEPDTQIATDRLCEVGETLLDSASLSRSRVAVLGVASPGLMTMLGNKAAFGMAVALDSKEAMAMALRLPAGAMVATASFDEALRLEPFDLVVGVDLARSLTKSRQSKVIDLIKPNGTALFIEETPTSFSLMTGRHTSADMLDVFKQLVRKPALKLRDAPWPDAPFIRILRGRNTETKAPQYPAISVHGEGEFADALRSFSDPDGPTIDVIIVPEQMTLWDAAISAGDAFRSLPDTKNPLWVMQKGDLGSYALRGWRRSLANELGRDLRTATLAGDAAPEFVASVLASTAEQELEFDGPEVFSFRLRAVPSNTFEHGNRKVLAKNASNVSRVSWHSTARVKPKENEIEIEVCATGLNFRDLMWAQNLLPFDAVVGGFAGPTLGMECTGTVKRAGVTSGYEVGQQVIAVAPQAFTSHATFDGRFAIALPDNVSLTAAAGLPVAFVTALYSLKNLAALKKEDSVLIHSAAGGVGLAAIQIAKNIGATVFATAGSSRKRKLLQAMGVDHVLDSRSLCFADEIAELTQSRGVDVVLNSLAGQAMEKSIDCLAPFGRFIELGKRDFLQNTPLPIRPLRRNITYFGVDVDQLLKGRPDIVKGLFDQIRELLESGDIDILPTRVFMSDGIEDALGCMQNARHTGKIVVRPPSHISHSGKNAPKPIRGTWLVVGGTRGFGFQTAKWLIRLGAESLWIASQGGQIDHSAEMEIRALADHVQIRRCDITNRQQTERLIAEIETSGEKLAGVVHAAMVLRDKQFSKLSSAEIDEVMAPKILGAENLDLLTRDLQLDHFLLFGSIASRIGSVGQAPYAAANLALEEVTARRTAMGLPGLTVAWGPIGDIGYLAENPETRDLVEANLGVCQSSAQGLLALSKIMSQGGHGPTITIAPNIIPKTKFAVLDGPLFSDVAVSRDVAEADVKIGILALLRNKGEDAARKALMEIVCGETANVMRISHQALDIDRPLSDIGFDSLMGMNLLLNIENKLGNSLSLSESSMQLSIRSLTSKILSSIQTNEPTLTQKMANKHLSSSLLVGDQLDRIESFSENLEPPV